MEWYESLDSDVALMISILFVGALALVLLICLKRGRISKRGFFPILVLTICHPFIWSSTFETPDPSQKSGALVFALAALIVFFWGLYRPTISDEP